MEHNDGDALAAKLGREPTKTIQQALLLMKAGILPTNIKTSPLVISHSYGKSPCLSSVNHLQMGNFPYPCWITIGNPKNHPIVGKDSEQ